MQAQKNPTTLYVKDLAFNVDDDKLRNHFSQCGKVMQTLVVRNAQGRSRGFGFVELEDEEQAQAALGLTGSELCGREIVVSKSQRAITSKKQNQEKSTGIANPSSGNAEDSGDETSRRESKGKTNLKRPKPPSGQRHESPSARLKPWRIQLLT